MERRRQAAQLADPRDHVEGRAGPGLRSAARPGLWSRGSGVSEACAPRSHPRRQADPDVSAQPPAGDFTLMVAGAADGGVSKRYGIELRYLCPSHSASE